MAAKKPRKKTAKQRREEATRRQMKNPLTGKDPNTYSQGLDTDGSPRELWDPVNVGDEQNADDPYMKRTQKRARLRAEAYDESGASRMFSHPIYGPNQHIDSPEWAPMTGLEGYELGGRGFKEPPPSVKSGPAINEPHEVDPDLPHFRRLEDLSGREYRKGIVVLKRRGITPESMVQNLVDGYESASALGHAMYQEHPAGTGFYQDEDAANPTKPEELLRTLSSDIEGSEAYAAGSRKSSPRAIAAVATSDTSPNAKVVINYKDANRPPSYPNHGGARAATEHVLAGGEPKESPKAPGVYHTNIKKAAGKVKVLLHTDTGAGQVFDPREAPKTAAFYGAQYKPSTSDSMTVVDVHAQHAVAPHLSTSESQVFDVIGPDGQPHYALNMDGSVKKKAMSHTFEAEDIGPDGMPNPHMARQRLRHYGLGSGYTYQPRLSPVNNAEGEIVKGPDGQPKLLPAKGGSPTEELFGKGKYPVYAHIDYAHRAAAARLGLAASVNHAFASNHLQEVAWEKERLDRPDIDVTHDTAFPGWRSRLGMGDYQTLAENDDPLNLANYDMDQASRNVNFKFGSGQ